MRGGASSSECEEFPASRGGVAQVGREMRSERRARWSRQAASMRDQSHHRPSLRTGRIRRRAGAPPAPPQKINRNCLATRS